MALGLTCTAIAVWIIKGVKVYLNFSKDGITLRDKRGRFLLGWDAASNFHTLKPFILTEYLVAEPRRGGEWFIGPWQLDDGGLIRICDLTEQLSRPVDEDRLGGFLFGVLAWSFDEFAVDEGRASADQGDKVGSVDGAPAVLR